MSRSWAAVKDGWEGQLLAAIPRGEGSDPGRGGGWPVSRDRAGTPLPPTSPVQPLPPLLLVHDLEADHPALHGRDELGPVGPAGLSAASPAVSVPAPASSPPARFARNFEGAACPLAEPQIPPAPRRRPGPTALATGCRPRSGPSAKAEQPVATQLTETG